MKLQDFIVYSLTLAVLLWCAFILGIKSVEPIIIEQQSDFIWIGDNRYHRDSIINCEPIYGFDTEIIGSYIKVSYGNNDIFIECLDKDGHEWEEFQTSWLMAFRGIE